MNPAKQGFAVSVAQTAVFGILMFTGIGVHAQLNPRPFSADQITTRGNKTTTAKVYGTEKAIRVESKDNKGKQSINIMRLDQKAVWVLMPDQKMYMDMGKLGAASMDMATSVEGAKVERESVGSEQVGAYHCDKYRVRATLEGHVYTSFEWDAKELSGFPVKQASEKGDWSKEFQNVQLGPQDPSLFEIPPGYTKMSLGGMLGNR